MKMLLVSLLFLSNLSFSQSLYSVVKIHNGKIEVNSSASGKGSVAIAGLSSVVLQGKKNQNSSKIEINVEGGKVKVKSLAKNGEHTCAGVICVLE